MFVVRGSELAEPLRTLEEAPVRGHVRRDIVNRNLIFAISKSLLEKILARQKFLAFRADALLILTFVVAL
jgi:hypothetical protein